MAADNKPVPVPVRFLKPTLISDSGVRYLQGETAWFNEVTAAALMRQGFAERVSGLPPYVPPRKAYSDLV